MTNAVDRMSRLLALVPWLRAHDGITVAETAVHFGVSPDQLERDLWLLVVCGIPGYGPDQLIDIDFWDDGHIHVRDPLTLDAPMRLSAEEATALIIALDALIHLPGSPPAMDAARAKLISVMDSEREAFVDVTGLPEGHIYSVLSQAIAEGKSVNLTYASGTSGKITQRQVVPERIESVTGRHLLLGYCHMSSAQRSFRLDRIVEVDLGGYAEVPAPADEIPYEPVSVRCSLSPSAEWIADVHPVEVMGMTSDGRLDVRISVFDPLWIVGLTMSLSGHLEVREPAHIRELVVQETRQALTAYARGIQ